jgi:hypothetical protein
LLGVLGYHLGDEKRMKRSQIVHIVDHIESLKDEDVEKINKFLKMDECDLRIAKSEKAQIREMKDGIIGFGKMLKGAFDEI